MKRSSKPLEPARGVAALSLRESAGHVDFDVRVAPKAKHSGVAGVHAGALKVSLTAPPVDGAANAALLTLLAATLSVPKSALAITRGHTARTKTVRVHGLSAAAVRDAFGRT